MFSEGVYGVMGDGVAFIHFLYVMFVLIAQALIVFGVFKGWYFIRNFIFRTIHLIAIMIVAVQELIGVRCPLTVLEHHLNKLAGRNIQDDLTFLGRLLRTVTYHNFPDWAFTLMYVGFGVIVLMTMVFVRPNIPKRFFT